jgi:hypothetical protein
MKKLLLPLAVGLFGITLSLNAGESTGIEGNYKLVSHKTPDGKVVKAPHLAGMINLTPGGYKNLNVMYRGVTSKSESISVIARYKLTGSTYTETLLSAANDPITGKVLASSGVTKSAKVTREGGSIKFTPPFESAQYEFKGDKLIATLPDKSVDTWVKVK